MSDTSLHERPARGEPLDTGGLDRRPDGAASAAGQDERQSPYEHAHNVYKAYRDYIVHEDDLVNQRTTWSITIQSFVIAIFGLTYQKKMEGIITFYGLDDKNIALPIQSMRDLAWQFDLFLLGIAFFGLAVASISGAAVYAAQRAIRFVSTGWASVRSGAELYAQFPSLTGGGNAASTTLGHFFPLALPVFLASFWLSVILYVAVFQKELLGNGIVPAPH